MPKKHKNTSVENMSIEKEIKKEKKQQAKQSQENKQKFDKHIDVKQSSSISIDKNSLDASISVED